MSGQESALEIKIQVIVTSKIRSYLIKAYTFGNALSGHPFKWNREDNRPEMGSKRQQIHWGFNMVLAFAYAGFIFVRTLQINLDDESTNSRKIYMRFMAAYFSLSVALHIGVILCKAEMANMASQYMDFIEGFEQEFVIAKSKPQLIGRVIGFVMTVVYQYMNLMTVLIPMITMTRPHSPDQLTSLFGDPKNLSWPARFPFAVFLVYILYIYHSSAYAVIQNCFLFATSLSMMNELNPNKASLTKGYLREPKVVVRVFREYHIMNFWFNQIYGNVFIPAAKALLLTWCVLCTYGAIRMHGFQALSLGIMGLFSFVFLSVTFTFLAELHHRSFKLLEYWKTSKETGPWFRKCLKAMPVLSFKLRGYYYVDRPMVLTMLDCMIEETVTFLLFN